jgi:hypothetical protein
VLCLKDLYINFNSTLPRFKYCNHWPLKIPQGTKMRNFTKRNLHTSFKTRTESGTPVPKINLISKTKIKSHHKLLIYILNTAVHLSCQFILILLTSAKVFQPTVDLTLLVTGNPLFCSPCGSILWYLLWGILSVACLSSPIR